MTGAVVTKRFILRDLGCPNCAAKMEAAIRKLEGVSEAAVVFASGTLIMKMDASNAGAIIESAKAIVKGIEPEVEVVDPPVPDSAGCDSHDHAALSGNALRSKWLRLAVSGAVFASAVVTSHLEGPAYAAAALYLFSYLFSGGNVLLNAGRNILKGRIFDEDFLISIATIGAFAIGYYDEGVAVMLFFQVGMLLQSAAAGRSRRSIAELMDIRPDYANLKTGGDVKTVSPEAVEPGDLILVKPGEKIPLDGVVTEGESMVDASALTGESVPREVLQGSEVLAGFVNKNGLLTIRVTKAFGQSTASKILDMMQNASTKKAPVENAITTFARYYTPAVTGAALLIATIPPLALSQPFGEWVYRALVFLVISCPCALVLSIPLGFFGGIGAASRIGVLVKGGNYLEALRDVDTIAFDKTGTLTKGVFAVSLVRPNSGFGKDELLRMAALAGAHSAHPVAVSIRKAYARGVNAGGVGSFEEIAGFGTKADVGGKTVLVGNARLMDRENVVYEASDSAGTVIYVSIAGQFAGTIVISDQIRPDSASTIRLLRESGVRKLVMLTGDNKAAADAAARELGLDAVYAELLPDRKVSVVEELLKEVPEKRKLVFVGDGINDAPVLARADVGVAMGGLGSDPAIEAADVVLMTDEPGLLLGAIAVARKTKRIVWQNIAIALGVKAAVLLLGAIGLASMWAAVFADVGVALLAVLNALRVLRVKAGFR